MKLLLIGAGGQLGHEICAHNDILQNHTLIPLSHQTLDITHLDAVLTACSHYQPDLVINAAAHTKVDQAEIEPEAAYAVNTQGAANLAEVCGKLDIPLIHFSTDYIFNGEKEKSYTEEDAVSSLNRYGESKWQGEVLVRQYCPKHVILRVSWIFGIYGNNFLKTILRLTREKTEIRIVKDQYGCPTPALSIADAVFNIIQKTAQNVSFPWGTYHFCGEPIVSWYAFAQTIVETISHFETLKVQKILPISGQEYQPLVRRPKNSSLSCEKITSTLGIQVPNWIEYLTAVVPMLLKHHNNLQ